MVVPVEQTAVPSTVIDHIPPGTLDAASARVRLAEAVPSGLDGHARDCEGGGCVFGQPWLDVDGDGCDQRSQVLAGIR